MNRSLELWWMGLNWIAEKVIVVLAGLAALVATVLSLRCDSRTKINADYERNMKAYRLSRAVK